MKKYNIEIVDGAEISFTKNGKEVVSGTFLKDGEETRVYLTTLTLGEYNQCIETYIK